MDADGSVDVVAMGSGVCTLWLGDGAGGWTQSGGFVAAASNDTGAFEVGGDIDHNGISDVVFVQREGSWPNDRNRLRVYRDDSTPPARRIVAQRPRSNEVWRNGSVQTVRWTAAQIGEEPAAVDIEISPGGPEGPWQSIALGVPDGGHRQWTVAASPSTNAHLRLTLHQAGDAQSTVVGPISIVGDAPASLPGNGSLSIARHLVLLSNPVGHEARFRIAQKSPALMGSDGPGHDLGAPAGADSRVAQVRIFGLDGRLVRVVRVSAAGEAVWDLVSQQGRPVAAGTYWARFFDDRSDGRGALAVTVVR
jgi:hypothetical protein